MRWCWNKHLRTDLVDEAVWQEVCQWLEHPERLEQEYRRRLVQTQTLPDLEPLERQVGRVRKANSTLD